MSLCSFLYFLNSSHKTEPSHFLFLSNAKLQVCIYKLDRLVIFAISIIRSQPKLNFQLKYNTYGWYKTAHIGFKMLEIGFFDLYFSEKTRCRLIHKVDLYQKSAKLWFLFKLQEQIYIFLSIPKQSRIIFSWLFFQLLNPQCNSGTGVGVGGGGLLGGGGTTGTSSSLHSYRIEANSFRRKPAHQHTVFEFTK